MAADLTDMQDKLSLVWSPVCAQPQPAPPMILPLNYPLTLNPEPSKPLNCKPSSAISLCRLRVITAGAVRGTLNPRNLTRSAAAQQQPLSPARYRSLATQGCAGPMAALTLPSRSIAFWDHLRAKADMGL